MSPTRAIAFGTLIVGTLDALDAVIFFGLRGAAPIRIFQSIAAGLIGRSAAVQGGLATALLGVGLHFCIAFGIVSTYYIASRRIRVLTSHPLLCGALYGILVYLFMNFVVIPLSALGRGSLSLPVVRERRADSRLRCWSADRVCHPGSGQVTCDMKGMKT